MIAVKITGMVITAQYGTLGSGDILRTSEAFAAHLVNDCQAAQYIDVTELSEVKVPPAKSKPKRGQGSK